MKMNVEYCVCVCGWCGKGRAIYKGKRRDRASSNVLRRIDVGQAQVKNSAREKGQGGLRKVGGKCRGR